MTTAADSPSSSQEPEPSAGNATGTRRSVLYVLLGVLAGGLWSLARGAVDVAHYLGLWTGTLVLPAAIASIHSAWKGSWRGFGGVFFWLTLLLPLVRLAALALRREAP